MCHEWTRQKASKSLNHHLNKYLPWMYCTKGVISSNRGQQTYNFSREFFEGNTLIVSRIDGHGCKNSVMISYYPWFYIFLISGGNFSVSCLHLYCLTTWAVNYKTLFAIHRIGCNDIRNVNDGRIFQCNLLKMLLDLHFCCWLIFIRQQATT